MPSNLRSKIQSGPVKRSWVSVAAIGTSHSGTAIRFRRPQRSCIDRTESTAAPRISHSAPRTSHPAPYTSRVSVNESTPGAVGPIVRSTVRVDWSQFEGTAALRCTAGVAIVLLLGLLLKQPLVSAFGAIGALSVGFGSFQGAYRSRAAVMVFASIGMALSVFAGSVAGWSDSASVVVATMAAFTCGISVALGPSASFVGLQSGVAAIIATGFPSDLTGAAVRGVLVLGGGLVQTLLVVMIWPLRRFPAERAALAAAYRSVADYAAQIPSVEASAPA